MGVKNGTSKKPKAKGHKAITVAASRAAAEARQAERNKRTPGAQLAILDYRLGVGKGAERERARLMKMEAA